MVTFKNAGLVEVLSEIPLEYLVLETDAPYLAPTPFRGKRNESAYVALVAQRLAEVNPEARFWVEPALQERRAASTPVLP